MSEDLQSVLHDHVLFVPDHYAICIEKQISAGVGDRCAAFICNHAASRFCNGATAVEVERCTCAEEPMIAFALTERCGEA